MDCAIQDVMAVIKDLGVRFRYTIHGALQENRCANLSGRRAVMDIDVCR
jgi:hypothetical protein